MRTFFKNKSWFLIPVLFLFLTESAPAIFAAENPPAFLWTKPIVEIKGNTSEGIAVDAAGNVFVTGRMDFEQHQSMGTHGWSHKGGKVFVAKYDPSGNLLWLQKSGGGSNDHAIGNGIAVDGFGDVYVTGSFSGKINFNETKLTSKGELDSFLAKYDTNGKLIWVKQAGGKDSFCESCGVTVDKKGNIYITGNFVGKAAFGTDDMISRSGIEPGHQSDMFLVKYDSAGNTLWMRQAGEMGENTGHAIAVDGGDNVYVTGRFAQGRGVTLSISFEKIKIVQIERVNNTDTNENCLYNFIVKYNSDGKVLWAEPTAGVSFYGAENSIEVNKVGQIYVAGSFKYTVKISGISLTNTTEGNDEIFLVKYDANGKILWGRSAGGKAHDECLGVTVDDTGNAYIAGYFSESATFGSIQVRAKPHDPQLDRDPAFVAKYNSSGDVVWVKSMDAGNGFSTVTAIAHNETGHIYITGMLGDFLTFDTTTLKPIKSFWGQVSGGLFVAKLGVGKN